MKLIQIKIPWMQQQLHQLSPINLMWPPYLQPMKENEDLYLYISNFEKKKLRKGACN